jgi:hypothetical protein
MQDCRPVQRGEAKEWTDDAQSDLGVALVEALAYVGDLLSRYQDEIAAEARLKTRRRNAFALLVLVVLVVWRRRGAIDRHIDRCIAAK